jgi:hypothetical protein
MRQRAPVVVGLALAAAGFTVMPAAAEDGYRHGRIRYVEPGVTLQRATEVAAEEAVPNLPFLPGDRVWTDAGGRAELQFPDGTLVRLDRRSKLDYAGHEEGQEERIVLRLWSGSLVLRPRTHDFARFEVETPGGIVQASERGVYRVDVEAGAARVSVYQGEATLDDGRSRVRVSEGQQTFARWGETAQDPEPFDRDEGDDFAAWDGEREAREARSADSRRYLPDELIPYASDFDQNGRWYHETSVGYVWQPYVNAGWQPYWNGYWAWTPYGWTWVPHESWGWAPFHYGRWDFTASLGWYWIPGRVWGPGWVSWAVGGGYVGWCPLGHRDRRVMPWDDDRGHAVPRGGLGPLPRGRAGAWSLVRQADLGARELARRRVSFEGVDPTALRVADSARLRPTRDARSLRDADATPRAIRTRPTPGDFVRELAVDNQTTIPSPWLRRPGSVPRSDEMPRYQRDPAEPRGEGAVGRAAPRSQPESARKAEREAAAPLRGRPATPSPIQPTPRNDGVRTERARPTEPNDGSRNALRRLFEPGTRSEGADRGSSGGRDEGAVRPRAGNDSAAAASRPVYRPRNDGEAQAQRGGGETYRAYRPQGSGDRQRPQGESGGYRPQGGGYRSAPEGRSYGGGTPRPPAAQARPSGGSGSGHSSGGSGHTASRPRHDR